VYYLNLPSKPNKKSHIWTPSTVCIAMPLKDLRLKFEFQYWPTKGDSCYSLTQCCGFQATIPLWYTAMLAFKGGVGENVKLALRKT